MAVKINSFHLSSMTLLLLFIPEDRLYLSDNTRSKFISSWGQASLTSIYVHVQEQETTSFINQNVGSCLHLNEPDLNIPRISE